MMILAQTVLQKFHPKPSEAAFSTVFFVLTSDRKGLVAVEYVGMDLVILGQGVSSRNSTHQMLQSGVKLFSISATRSSTQWWSLDDPTWEERELLFYGASTAKVISARMW